MKIVVGAAKRVILVAAMVMALAAPARADVYKWTDEKGGASFTDDPSSIPEKHRPGAHRVDTPPVPQSAAMAPDVEAAADGEADEGGPRVFVAAISPMGDGFTVKTSINGGVEVSLLVDTGSSFTIVSPRIAAQLGYANLEDLPRLPVSTAGGVSWIYLITLDRAGVGGAVVEDVEGGVSVKMERGLDGLLGMSFLKEFGYRIDSAKGEIALKPAPQDGETYGGKGKEWWRSRYEHYAGAIRRFTSLKERIAKGGASDSDPVMRKITGFDEKDMGKIADYYRGLFERLERRAAMLGVPREWRVYP